MPFDSNCEKRKEREKDKKMIVVEIHFASYTGLLLACKANFLVVDLSKFV